MKRLDLTPLYRSSIGFDRFGTLLDTALKTEHQTSGYPPYNIESRGEDRYSITLAVAGFDESEIDIQTEKGILTVQGKKQEEKLEPHTYLYQGIANRSFERKFNLADFVEVTDANLDKGLLTISLVKEIPEAMKPKNIAVSTGKTIGDYSKDKAA